MQLLKLLIGVLLIVIGYLGRLFFRHYHGHLIANKDVYGGVSLLMIFLGAGIIYFSLRSLTRKEDEE